MKKIIFLSLISIGFAMGLSAQNIIVKDGLYYADNGKLYSGIYTSFSSDGIKKSAITVNDGKTNGAVTYYYANGNIMETGAFADNEKSGQWIRYNEEGKKTGEAYYVSGKKDGTWIVWDFNGIKRCQMHYAMGEKTGKWTMWDENGNLSNEKTYSSL